MRTPRTIRRRHGQWRSLWRALRYRLIVPVFRSPHPPEYTARGVANGVFWGLTPSVGLQTIAIVATWLVAHKVCGRPSSLLQAFIWVWVNNPVTMVPMYYLFYVTGLWMLGEAGPANGYHTFVALWDANTAGGWFDGLVAIARSIGVPIVIGSAPYATTGGALSYRWALRVVRRRKARACPVTGRGCFRRSPGTLKHFVLQCVQSSMPAMSDIRYALRLLARRPIFTMTAMLSLAIGIAASAAIFSLADALLLRPRAGVANPATLIDVGRSTGGGLDNFDYPLFAAMRERTTLLQAMSAHRLTPDVMSLGDAQSSERVFASLVSANYFDLIGVRAVAGRFFFADEDKTPGAHPVVVLTHQFWTRRFGADPAIVGQTIRLNNLPYTVVGIAEKEFSGTTFVGTDLWAPMAMDAHVRASDRSLLDEHQASWMTAIGRLRPGVTVAQARDELGAIMRTVMTERADPRIDRWTIAVAPSARVPAPIAGPVVGFVAMLGALTGLVLLIACSNVAAMLLARALERRREVATRLAIGATRGRILTQLLMEGLMLAVIAGVLSVPLADALVGLIGSFQPSLPIPIAIELRVDWRVAAFAFGLAALTSILFALLPALQATRFAVAPALHGANTTPDRRRAWLRHGLVSAQIALALVLLVAAGLFLRSLQMAARTDPGFNADNVDTLQIDTRIAGYRTDAEGVSVIESLTDRFRLLPGVTAVGASRMVPLISGGLGLGGLRAPGYVGPDGTNRVEADWDVVSTGYFAALEVPLAHGRAFDARDRTGTTFVAIVNEKMAAQLWPGEDPIRRRLIQAVGRDPGETRTLEIVGVARNAKHRMISEPQRNFIYVPLAQQFMSDISFYVRRGADGSRISDLRKAVAAFDPNLPVIHAQTLREATSIALLPQRLAAWIAGSVGTIGLLLAAIGIYGLTAFSVAQRTREIALRMALGASRESVLSLILRQSARLALIGTVAGLALALGVSQLVSSFVVGLGPADPIAFGIATVVLIGVLFAASWSPARRAARMDPMRALRAE